MVARHRRRVQQGCQHPDRHGLAAANQGHAAAVQGPQGCRQAAGHRPPQEGGEVGELAAPQPVEEQPDVEEHEQAAHQGDSATEHPPNDSASRRLAQQDGIRGSPLR